MEIKEEEGEAMTRKELENINRMNKTVFVEYFSRRPVLFRDTYNRSLTTESVVEAYRESMNLVLKCRRGESGGIL